MLIFAYFVPCKCAISLGRYALNNLFSLFSIKYPKHAKGRKKIMNKKQELIDSFIMKSLQDFLYLFFLFRFLCILINLFLVNNLICKCSCFEVKHLCPAYQQIFFVGKKFIFSKNIKRKSKICCRFCEQNCAFN